MPKQDIEVSIYIARSPEYIWNYLCDVSNEILWWYGVIFADWISDPPYRVGSLGFHFVKGLGDYPWKVAEWEELRNISWDVLDGRFKNARAGYRILPENPGSRVTIYVSPNQNLFLTIMTFVMKRFFIRQLNGDLERLKATMEA
jgi:hypothetical protein